MPTTELVQFVEGLRDVSIVQSLTMAVCAVLLALGAGVAMVVFKALFGLAKGLEHALEIKAQRWLGTRGN